MFKNIKFSGYTLTILCILSGYNLTFAKKYKPDSLSYSYKVSVDGFLNYGTSNRAIISSSNFFSISQEKMRFPLIFNFSYGTQGRKVLEREYLLNIKPEYVLTEKSYLFLISGFEKSNILSIKSRGISGLGFGWNFLKTDKNEISLSDAIMYEETNFETQRNELLKNSFRLKVRFKIYNFFLGSESMYQPSFFDIIESKYLFENYNWRSNNFLEFPIIKSVYFKFNFEHRHESAILNVPKKDDYKLTFGVSVSGN